MDRKLLFFDIDGTLLAGGYNGYVPESALKALHMAQANGHLCFINSGRTRRFVPKEVQVFPFDGYILGVGTEIILHDETLLHYEVPQEVLRSLPEICKRCNVQIVGEGPQYIYYDKNRELFPGVKSLIDAYQNEAEDHPIRTFDDDIINFSKFVIFFDESGDIPLFKELTKDYFSYIPRESLNGTDFAEIVPNGFSKAMGIDYLVEHLGLTLDDCYVFGDSNNDLSMLTHVKHSVAMGNSVPKIIGKTEYVTTDIDDDGIMNALKHYGLI
ncbi:MAG: Cof-type HAD-IIB family hydrolase [Eubacteriales bacterium]|nr:Cof-type HAD-IIB family hydrolase [Eubacteriales bacterium]